MRYRLLLLGIGLTFVLLVGVAADAADPEQQGVVKVPTGSPTATSTATPTETATATATPTDTAAPASTATQTATSTRDETPTPTPTVTPADTPTPSATLTPVRSTGIVGTTARLPTATAVPSATSEPAPAQAAIDLPSPPPPRDPDLAGVRTFPSTGDAGLIASSDHAWALPALVTVGSLIFAFGGLALSRVTRRH
jgi:hypothetical protein